MKYSLYSILAVFVFIIFSTGCDAVSGSGNPPYIIADHTSIIADHTSVGKYSAIPQVWINAVKKMWVSVAGESHSGGYRIGCNLLQSIDPKFPVSILESGTPEAYTDQHLRLSRATWGDRTTGAGWQYSYGEEDWYTNQTAIDRTKAGLLYCKTNNFGLSAMGFGWCWDMTWTNVPGGTIDPVYKVRWAGTSASGLQGNLIWGLDAQDQALTGNSVCMDTYLQATQTYIDYCTANSINTKVFFTTGPVDSYTGESAYQRYLKHEYIRSYVKEGNGRYLFDYADILCWNNAGQEQTDSWTDGGGVPRSFQTIHIDNTKNIDGSTTEDGDHIGEVGAIRLAKALWWFLARIEGWDGNP
jgi:hypothetical protein